MAQVQIAKASDLTAHTGNTSNPHGVTAAQVGLGSVDNTADADKPISTATQAALDAKAPLASPALTGTPTAPTATAGTNTTQIATTAFVTTAVAAGGGGGAGGPATEITETSGPTDLAIGAIASGQMLVRSGDTVVGQDVPSGTGAIGPEPGITADAKYVLGAATVAAGSTSLSVTGGAFAAGDVGKLIVLSRHRQVTDAAITAADATLTSATAAFTADDVGAEVLVSGAGAGGVSLLTTIASVTDASTVELALAASTTVSGKVATIGAQHATTIAGYTSATAVTLTTAPTPGFTASDVAWGTDQRAAISTAASTCATAGRALRLPRGKVFIALDGTNPWATTNLASSLSVLGYGEEDTEIVCVHNESASPTIQGGIFRVGAGERLRVERLSYRYVSLPNEYGQETYQLTNHQGANSTLNVLELWHVRTRGSGLAAQIQGNNNAPTRMRIMHCDLECWGLVLAHFRDGTTNGGGTDHEHIVRNTKLRNMAKWTTSSSDSAWHAHLLYKHGCVWLDWDHVTTQQDQEAGWTAYVIHDFGSPTAVPKAVSRINALITSGGGQGILSSGNSSGSQYASYHITDSVFGHVGPAGTLNGPIHLTNCRLLYGGLGVNATRTIRATNRVERCVVNAIDAGSSGISCGGAGSVWNIEDCTFILNGTTADRYGIAGQNSGAGTRYQINIRNPKFYGEAGNTKGYAMFFYPSAEVYWDGGSLDGAISAPIAPQITADDQTRLHFRGVRCAQSGPLIPSNVAQRKGNITGEGCNFETIAAMPSPHSAGSMAFVPKPGTSGTSLTVASNTLYLGTMGFAAYDVTGGGTVNNILAGDASNQRPRIYGGDLVIRANGAALTLAHAAGGTGNLRAKALADRTVADGESIRLRHDERNGIWYEV